MGFLAWLFGPQITKITIQEAHQRLQDAQPPLLLDVRQPVEVAATAVPGAINIPLTELSRRMAELPPDQPILTICRSAHRSPIAARRLAKAGFDVTDVAGGVTAWEKAGLPISRGG